jgi:hypothetical protein
MSHVFITDKEFEERIQRTQAAMAGQKLDALLAFSTESDRKSTRLNSSHNSESRMPSSA